MHPTNNPTHRVPCGYCDGEAAHTGRACHRCAGSGWVNTPVARRPMQWHRPTNFAGAR